MKLFGCKHAWREISGDPHECEYLPQHIVQQIGDYHATRTPIIGYECKKCGKIVQARLPWPRSLDNADITKLQLIKQERGQKGKLAEYCAELDMVIKK